MQGLMDEDAQLHDRRSHPGTAEHNGLGAGQHGFRTAPPASSLSDRPARLPPLSPRAERGPPPRGRIVLERQISATAPTLEELAVMTDDDIAAMHGWDPQYDKNRIANFRRARVMKLVSERELRELAPPGVAHDRRERPLLDMPYPDFRAPRGLPPWFDDGAGRGPREGSEYRHASTAYNENEVANRAGRGGNALRTLVSSAQREEQLDRPADGRGDEERAQSSSRTRGPKERRQRPEEDQLRVSRTVVIEGAKQGVNEREIADWFAREGRVVAVRLGVNGRAWVEFSAAEEAKTAIVNFSRIRGRDAIRVSESRTAIRNNTLGISQSSSGKSAPSRVVTAGNGRPSIPTRGSHHDLGREQQSLQGGSRQHSRSRSPLLRRQKRGSDSNNGRSSGSSSSGSSDRGSSRRGESSDSLVLRRDCSHSPKPKNPPEVRQSMSHDGTANQGKADEQAPPPAWTPESNLSSPEPEGQQQDVDMQDATNDDR